MSKTYISDNNNAEKLLWLILTIGELFTTGQNFFKYFRKFLLIFQLLFEK